MNAPCSTELLESALTGNLAAEDETSLERHLESCDQCSAALEHMAGGHAWRQEVAALLTRDELDAAAPTCDEWSAIDFTVEHLEPADDPNVLGRLGDYDVLEIIGRGGMGVVLKGFDRELKRCVAIKVLAPHLAQSALAKKRFAREAQAAAAVVHPHVLAIHQVQAGGRLPFLVMPLVAGESLAERLTAQGRLELKETLRIGMQAAAGLAAAHEQGLVHRDVKPANILLEKGVERAVLTDFGLARAADDATLTRWGVIAGTPQYMSPEQARGEPLDGRSDLFSLGCVLYEMATGVSPFRADSMMATLRRLVDDPPQAILALNAEAPPWFIGIVDRLLEKDPARRFDSAREVSELLEQCLAHVQQPAVAPLPAGLSTRASSGFRRPPVIKWVAAAAFGFLIVACAVVIVVDWKKGTVTISSDDNAAVVDVSRKGAAKAKVKGMPATGEPGGKTLGGLGDPEAGEPTELSFGPIMKRIVNDDDPAAGNFFIDLDSGTVMSPPADLDSDDAPEVEKWLTTNSVDAMGETKSSVHGLMGFDMIVIPIANDQWDCSPAFLLKQLALGSAGTPALMSGRGELPVTFFVQTREGGQGVLQIVGFIDKPRGVRIRFKLLQSTNVPGGKTLKGAGGEKPQKTAAEGRSLIDAIAAFNKSFRKGRYAIPLAEEQLPLTVDEVVAAIRWAVSVTKVEGLTPQLKQEFREIAERGVLPAGWKFESELLLRGADGENFLGWKVLLRCKQPKVDDFALTIRQQIIEQIEQRDGKFSSVELPEIDAASADGAATPLAAAINGFNKQWHALGGVEMPPLTMREVVAAIRWQKTRRDELNISNGEFAALQKIAETRMLPAGAEIEIITDFQPGDGNEYKIWSVRLSFGLKALRTLYPHFDIMLRNHFVRSTPIDGGKIVWGAAAENGFQAGVRLEPRNEQYVVGQHITPHFFFRNGGEGTESVSFPNLMTRDYYEEITASDASGRVLEIVQDDARLPGPVGWIEVPFGFGAQHEIRGLPIVLGDVKRGAAETAIRATPGQSVRLRFTLPNYAEGGGAQVQTGDVEFTMAEAPPWGDDPADWQKTPPRERYR